MSCQKTRISDVQFFLTKREHILVTNKEREAANVFSNNKLCHLSLLLQEKHFKSRNAFKSWMYHVATVIGSYFSRCIYNHYCYCFMTKNTYRYNEPLRFLLWKYNIMFVAHLSNRFDRQWLHGRIWKENHFIWKWNTKYQPIHYLIIIVLKILVEWSIVYRKIFIS